MSNRYRDIPKLEIPDTRRRYTTNPMYPTVPLSEDDIYIITSIGDRYDLLANSFYGDPKLWWIIASANNATADDLSVKSGVQIRVPASKDRALILFEQYNKLR
jgi:hypothetical protein